ncbi:MAG TPA: trehalose-6-phosphate synthase [Acidimicrobiales bacterium]|nr:trehalose-6-phosphate synthase [Acidimicrobiales bacterium]
MTRPSPDGSQFVVVANRLPVDRVVADGEVQWTRSPGGLVTALEPVMRRNAGTWVGWPGVPDLDVEPFDTGGMHLVPVTLSAEEVAEYYEGFANGTLWPLYHDVTGEPVFDRRWWDRYVAVNRRFADITAKEAGKGATVWVQDYQLQLTPAMLRRARPDLSIGFFNHIPFPGWELFSRLPWRRQVVEGLLGADLVGFQRGSDASNFLRAARATTAVTTRGSVVEVPEPGGEPSRRTEGGVRLARAAAFPISIDAESLSRLAATDKTLARSKELRKELGEPRRLLLGVDRLDYTKGILQRLRAYGELLDEGRIGPPDEVLLVVASPSRERVEEYQRLRDEVEAIVGRINGDHSTLGRPAVHYLHRTLPQEELAALYRAADVMLVTPLRDGMNLVAKEYVACRNDLRGALVLSEFTGAADELRQAFLINPWDIDGTKAMILRALDVDPADATRRMRALRRRVAEFDVHHWASAFLGALEMVAESRSEAAG